MGRLNLAPIRGHYLPRSGPSRQQIVRFLRACAGARVGQHGFRAYDHHGVRRPWKDIVQDSLPGQTVTFEGRYITIPTDKQDITRALDAQDFGEYIEEMECLT